MLTELKKLAGEFVAQPTTRGREMRDLLEHSPAEFRDAAIEILSGEDSERVKRYLVALLWTNNLLMPCLIDPSTPPQQAELIAALARRVDPELPAKLVGFVLERTDVESPECIERILGLLKSMPDAASFRPLLTPLLRHPNARVRSKVALLAGEGNRNRTWFERRMLEDDPRVRANAIESAGSAVAEDLRLLFRTAASDTNNRVVGNALIALYRLGEAEAVASLHELISRPDPAFRATAVWAMGETGDARFLPLLTRILTDPNETIKAATFRAIRKLRGQESVNTLPLDVRILSEPALCGSTLKVTFGVSGQSNPILGISPTAVRILLNGEFVYRYSVTELECRRRISAAFLMPRTGNGQPERLAAYQTAMERCYEQRRAGDAWMLSRHAGFVGAGDAARPETLFGVRIDSAEMGSIQTPDMSAIRPVTSLSGLRAAFDSGASMKSSEFTVAFLALCQELRLSRVSSHLFLLHPETAQPVDPASLTRSAQDAHVTVHAVCGSPDAGFREICQATGGFYTVGEDITEMLLALYRGISHRYQASLTLNAEVRSVQVAVRSPESFGKSPIVEVNI
jgi:HEAT repeat protein